MPLKDFSSFLRRVSESEIKGKAVDEGTISQFSSRKGGLHNKPACVRPFSPHNQPLRDPIVCARVVSSRHMVAPQGCTCRNCSKVD
jgi:hypothetical protein